MVQKSTKNKITITNKNNNDEPNENQRGSTEKSKELKKRSGSAEKRFSRRRYPRKDSQHNISSRSPAPAMDRYHRFRYPVSMPDWNLAARMRFQNYWHRPPYHRFPAHNIMGPQMMPPYCRFPGRFTYPPPPIAQLIRPHFINDEIPTPPNYYHNVFSPEQIVPNVMCEPQYSEFDIIDDPPFYEAIDRPYPPPMDQMEYYLSLPKELFPNTMNLFLDPNPMIDGFCKYNAVLDHAPWIMDLEFGEPREATTRQIALYDVKNNSVQCRHSPNDVHPGFEVCHPEFKYLLTFYYDSVISLWYKGYIELSQDRSVDNFQSWVGPPMQEFGMCWL